MTASNFPYELLVFTIDFQRRTVPENVSFVSRLQGSACDIKNSLLSRQFKTFPYFSNQQTFGLSKFPLTSCQNALRCQWYNLYFENTKPS